MIRKKSTTRRKKATATRPKRRVTRKKKGMLSELFNANMAQAGGKVVLSGAVGGIGAGFLAKVLPDTMPAKTKAMYQIAGGFAAATVLKMPNVGAGMAGVGMYNLFTQSGYLADGFAYADDLEALPMVLDEDGAAYLQEGAYLQDGGMFLQENDGLSYDVGYYGAGFGLDNM
jgi:hypothetical protein